MALKSIERFYLTLEVDMDSRTVILIKDGKEGRTYDASQYFQYFVEYGVRKVDVAQLQEHFSINYFQNMLVTGENSEVFEFCVQFVGEDYKILKCKMNLGGSQNKNIIKIVLEDISHKRVQNLANIKNHFAQHENVSYAKPFDIKFEEKNNKLKKLKFHKYAIIFLGILCIFMSFVFFQNAYSRNLDKTSEETCNKCKSSSHCIAQKLNYNSLNLTIFKNLIFNIGTKLTKTEIIDYVEELKNEYGYEAIAFIGEDDQILCTENFNDCGNIEYLGNNFTFKTEECFAPKGHYSQGNAVIDYVLPVEELIIDDSKYKAIMVVFNLNKICNEISLIGNSCHHNILIINVEGDIIWCKNSDISTITKQQNLFDYLNSRYVNLNSKDGLENISENLQRKKSGCFSFGVDGQTKFAAYTPLEIENLYVVSLSKSSVGGLSEIKFILIFIAIWLIILMFPIMVFVYQMKKMKDEKYRLEEIAYRDDVTGGLNSNYFDKKAKDIICEKESQYALVATNLRNFNLYNATYGNSRGDELIRRLFLGISKYIDRDELLCRDYAEHMIILMKCENEKKLEERLFSIGTCIIDTSFKLEFGVCIIRDLNLDLKVVEERARMALKNDKKVKKGNSVIAYYDVKLLEKVIFEKELEHTMYRAFRQGEFKIFVEPRYKLKNRALYNGDAFAIWNHPEKGTLMPQQYMEVFQRRGLVMCLDFFIFEEICKKIQQHLDKGGACIYISIKLHRNHFNVTDFIKKFAIIKDRYGIPGKCFSFEISEKIIYEKIYQIDRIVDCIHKMDSNCIMGEYRGRYLPLESLCKVKIDAIKFDEAFLTQNIPDEMIKALISIAKVVNAKTVMTAVTKQSQISYLLKADCDEAKGDAFAKNISLDEYINIF